MNSTVPLWAPYYGAPFGASITRFWKKYARFDGRASRSEYWWWVLANAIVIIVLYVIMLVLGLAGATTDETGRSVPGPGFALGVLLFVAWGLATLVPGLALAARRLHDVNLSGWLLFLLLIPSLGGLAIFVMSLLPPNPEGARFDRPDGEVPGYVPVVPGAALPPRDYGWPESPLPYATPAGGQPLYANPSAPPPPAPGYPSAPQSGPAGYPSAPTSGSSGYPSAPEPSIPSAPEPAAPPSAPEPSTPLPPSTPEPSTPSAPEPAAPPSAPSAPPAAPTQPPAPPTQPPAAPTQPPAPPAP